MTRVQTGDSVEVQSLTPGLQRLKVTDLEKSSIGYETLTTVSDFDSEVRLSLQLYCNR